MQGSVTGVSASSRHGFAKERRQAIELLQGLGVKDDAHCGPTVQHLFDVRRDPSQPNLRQVHLMQAELLEQLQQQGFQVGEGLLGENVTTAGIALDSLPRATRLHLGSTAIVEVTGLRDPCVKMDRFQSGLRRVVTDRREGVKRFTRGGVMAIVVQGGLVRAGDPIEVELPGRATISLTLV